MASKGIRACTRAAACGTPVSSRFSALFNDFSTASGTGTPASCGSQGTGPGLPRTQQAPQSTTQVGPPPPKGCTSPLSLGPAPQASFPGEHWQRQHSSAERGLEWRLGGAGPHGGATGLPCALQVRCFAAGPGRAGTGEGEASAEPASASASAPEGSPDASLQAQSLDDPSLLAEAAADVAEDGARLARRVAPLPEDIAPTTPEREAAPSRGPSRKARRSAGGAAREEREDVPYPSFSLEAMAGQLAQGAGTGRKGSVGKGGPEELSLMDAIKRVKADAKAKFDESVEIHVKLGVDPKRSDQTVRGSAVLPRGSGKSSRVAVFAEGPKAEEARAAGADVVGGAELIQQIKDSGGKLDFDKCIAIPQLMPQLTQVARILGPKGLMPNPKMGTVTMNVAEAVATAKRGKADFRADRSGNVHCSVGKVSFPDEALRDNIAAVAAALLAAKPAGLKRTSKFHGYFTSCSLASTMGAGVRTSVPSISSAVDANTKAGASA